MTAESDPSYVEDTPWFLYLIECEGASIYTGITTDVARRYAAHVSGKGAKYTRARKPMQLLGWLEYPNKSEALKAEIRIKRLSAVQKRALVGELKQEPAQIKTPA